MRKWIPVPDLPADFEKKVLHFASKQEVACVLRSNSDQQTSRDPYSVFDWCMGIGAWSEMISGSNAFQSLQQFHSEKNDWLFGFLSYDLKNQVERLNSSNHDGQHFPDVHFFQPKIIFRKTGDEIFFGTHEEDAAKDLRQWLKEIAETSVSEVDDMYLNVHQRETRDTYESKIKKIKEHLKRGDVYEMNFCMEFYSEDKSADAAALFERLIEISPMPFSCFYKVGPHNLVSASPERFMAKRGEKIICQPIKGTARRGRSTEEDEQMKVNLYNDEKERSENVMIVDLVRNDLSRTAKRKSVRVQELFGIYTFRQLHQMISTVVSEIRADLHWTEVLQKAFPMGSMTGAPKIRAMQLIEQFEETKRGLYSGAVGYITPGGDFDFNVVIRSILYNETERYLSFMVGSAITINSDPAKEYDECLLKADAMLRVLKHSSYEKVS